MLQLVYELRKNCCGTDGRVEKWKVLQEVLADLKKLCILVFEFENFCGVIVHHLAALVQKELQNQNKKLFGTLYCLYSPH